MKKTKDLRIRSPRIGQNNAEIGLAEYIAKIEEGPYDRMFYVFHSGNANTDDHRVTVIGPDQLAELVMDTGLVSWLIRKVS